MSVEIIAKPHPLRQEPYLATAPAGSTLADLLGNVPEAVHAQVNGELWPRERWREPLPDGAIVNVYVVPRGDNALRLVAMIAVAVVAGWAGYAAAGAMGMTTATGLTTAGAFVAAGVSSVVSLAGAYAVNALIPPKLPDAPEVASSSVAKSITGTQNRMVPYGVIPRVYGNPRWFPPLAARPVTEVAGDDQYLRMLLCLGYGPLEIGGHIVGDGYPLLTHAASLPPGTIRIGDTSIEEFEDVEWEIGTIDQISLFSQDIQEEAVGAALDFQHQGSRDKNRWFDDNVSAVRTTAPNTSEIIVDLVFPQGLYTISSSGKTDGESPLVDFKIEYAPTGTGQWTKIPGDSLPRRDPELVWDPDSGYPDGGTWVPGAWVPGPIVDPAGTYIQVRGPVKQTVRRSYRWAVQPGQYDVRVTRVRTYRKSAEVTVANAVWTAMRSVRPQKPWTRSDTVLMALRIRATDQLSGVIDQLNIRTQALLPVWSGGSSTLQPTNNPAWAYLDAMTGAQVGRPIPINRINMSQLQDWAAWCEAQGLKYHWVHDAPETLLDRLRAIAAAGQATFALQDGLYGVIRDDPDAPVMQVVTPRNATGFSSQRQYRDLPHALRVKYIDPETWTDAERIVCRDGYYDPNSGDPIPAGAKPATVFEDLQTQGVASAEEAWHHGQYFMRQALLRPEVYQVQMDWENLALSRGDRARLAYDAILVGLAWGRITAIDGNIIALDEEVEMEAGRQYGVRVRLQTGESRTAAVQTVAGRTSELVLDDAISGASVGDLVVFGELGKETIDVKVIRIEPSSDFTATVTFVDSAPNIYDYGEPPAYDPGITTPPSMLPPMPVGLTVTSGADTYSVGPDGAIISRARASWQPVVDIWLQRYEVQWRNVADGAWTHLDTTRPWVYLSPVTQGEEIQVRVRAVNAYGASAWAETSHVIVAANDLPVETVPPVPDVRGLELYGQGNDTEFAGRDAKFVWRQVSITDFWALGYDAAEIGSLDAYFRDYQVTVIDVETGRVRRVEYTTDPEYIYTYEKNVEDSTRLGIAGPRRQFRIEVVVRGRQSQISRTPARLTVRNRAPELPGGWSLTPGYFEASASFIPPDDTDFRRINVYVSTQQGFAPGPENRVWQGSDSPARLPDLQQGTTYYYRYEAEDAFGPGAMSGELAFTTHTLAIPDVDGLEDAIGEVRQGIADLEEVYGDTVSAAESAAAAAQSAAEAILAKAAALGARDAAEGHAQAAAESSEAAAGYSTQAETAAAASQSARVAAEAARDAAQGHAQAASESASTAASKADEASTYAAAAQTARTAAETAAGSAETSATQAAQSATAADGAASSAAAAASTAATHAGNAANSATAAAGSASAAQSHADAAGNAASAAQAARVAAESARDSAQGHASAAATSASAASTAASEAAASAQAASQSATQASTASSQAGTYASQAAQAATTAQQHAQAAAQDFSAIYAIVGDPDDPEEGTLSAIVQQASQVVAQWDGELSAEWTLTVDAAGNVTGIKLRSDPAGSQMTFLASAFAFATPGGPYTPFVIENNVPKFLGRTEWSQVTGAGKPADGADNTKTVIDGGLVTTGTVQLQDANSVTRAGITAADTGDNAVRMWAGATFANRGSAPFRVTQNGKLFATGAEISGLISASTITGSTITGATITSSTLQTSESGQRFVASAVDNEAAFYGDNGYGQVTRLMRIGLSGDYSQKAICDIGATESQTYTNRIGVRVNTDSIGMLVTSLEASAIWAQSYGTGSDGVAGNFRAQYGIGGNFNAQYGIGINTSGGVTPLRLVPSTSASAPSHDAEVGSLWVTYQGVLYIRTRSGWQKVGEQ